MFFIAPLLITKTVTLELCLLERRLSSEEVALQAYLDARYPGRAMKAFTILLATLWCLTAAAEPRIGAREVKEEKASAMSIFLHPNEHGAHVYQEVVRGKTGALVSVGTFRTLDRSAQGDFSHVLMLDYDAATTDFNRLNTALIAVSKDRFQYLELLLGRKAHGQVLDQVRAGQMQESLFLAALMQSPPYTGPDPIPEYRRFRELLGRPIAEKMKRTAQQELESAIALMTSSETSRERTLFGSDSIFAKVKDQALRGEYIAINGSLTGQTSMASAAAALRAERIQVSVVDISNALNHIQILNPWGPGASRRVAENIRALPLAPDAVVLFSVHAIGVGMASHADQWAYFSVPAEKYIEAGKLGYFDTPSSYFQFIKTVFAARAEQPGGLERLIVPKDSFRLTEKPAFLPNWCKSQMTRLLTEGVMGIMKFLR